MNKIAIFVEGQTEQLFIEKLINRIFGQKNISIVKKSRKGKTGHRNFLELEAESVHVKYFILIIDCGQDVQVKSDILDQYEKLSSVGYQKIIGVRDVYPTVRYKEVAKLRDGLTAYLPAGSVSIIFILGIMEIEAWMLAEYTHFPKIHPKITIGRIKQELGIDIIHDDLAQREYPAKDLANIYWLENIPYDKNHKILNKVLDALDYECLKTLVSSKFTDLNQLCHEFELFFQKA